MNKRELEDAIREEVAEWPGVTVEFAYGGKHPKAKLMLGDQTLFRAFGGNQSFVVYPHKMIADMRAVMIQLGATRNEDPPEAEVIEQRYRQRNEAGVAARPNPVLHEPTPLRKSLADQLVGAGAAEPEQAAHPTGAALMARHAADAIEESTDEDRERELAELKAAIDGIKDGIYFGLSDRIYHGVPRLSTSALQKIDISPADFWKDSWLDPNPTVLTEEQEKKQSIARVVGAAYHTARLEPDQFELRYVREIDKRDYPRKGLLTSDAAVRAALKAMSAQQTVGGESNLERAERLLDAGYEGVILSVEEARWAETVNGRISLSPIVYDEILIDMQRIHNSGSIAAKMTGGAAEVSIFWTDQHGLKMKARIDYLRPDLWCDLKTFANPRRKPVRQVIADAFRYDRHHMQAVIYRDAIEQIRVNGLQIVGDATDEQRALIAAIQMRPGDLECWYIFQQKGGVPNLLARLIEFFEVPANTRANHAGASEAEIAEVERVARRRTQLHARADMDVARCKREFALYAQVYGPGEPWRPIEPEGSFGDDDFNQYWLEGR